MVSFVETLFSGVSAVPSSASKLNSTDSAFSGLVVQRKLSISTGTPRALAAIPVVESPVAPTHATVVSDATVKLACGIRALLQPEPSEILPHRENVLKVLKRLRNNPDFPGAMYTSSLLKKSLSKDVTRAATKQYTDAALEFIQSIQRGIIFPFNDEPETVRWFVRRVETVEAVFKHEFSSDEYKRREVNILRKDPRWEKVVALEGVCSLLRDVEKGKLGIEALAQAKQLVRSYYGDVIEDKELVTKRKSTGRLRSWSMRWMGWGMEQE